MLKCGMKLIDIKENDLNREYEREQIDSKKEPASIKWRQDG